MKALREIGVRRALRFVWVSLLLSLFRRAWLPPVRAGLLRLFGARVGVNTILHRISFTNVDRGGFRALTIGNNCFLADDVLIDLAAPVTVEDHVTLAVRVVILTHLNVGYRDHPLQKRFPSETAPVVLRRGSFVGAGATILGGKTIGPEAFVGAGSLVNRNVTQGETVGGVPIREITRPPAP